MINAAHLSEIQRRWPRYRWDYLGRSRWESWPPERYFGLGMAAGIGAATFLELALLSGSPWTFLALGLHPEGQTLILLLAALNAWTLNRWVAGHTGDDRRLSPSLRVLRPLTLGVPVLGLATIPAWKWIAETHPAWAFREAGCGSRLSVDAPRWIRPVARAELQLRIHGQRLPWLIAWMIACQAIPALGALSWLQGSGSFNGPRRILLVIVCAFLHLVAALCAALLQRQSPVDAPRSLPRITPWLLLLPGLGIVLLATLSPRSLYPREESLLVRTAYEKRQARALPLGPLLGPTLRLSSAELHRRAFFRLKTFLLALDAAALSWLGSWIGWNMAPEAPGVLLLLPILPGLLLAMAGQAAEWTGRWPSLREMNRHRYGLFLALAPAVLLSGFLLGSLQAQGDVTTVGKLLVVLALSSLWLTVGAILLSSLASRSVQAEATVALWFLLWFELICCGIVLTIDPDSPLAGILTVSFLLSPIWSLGLYLALGQRLLKPFTLRHLADPRLPFRNRLILGAVALSALLPLGGLAIPFWIYVYHRSWERLERSWVTELR